MLGFARPLGQVPLFVVILHLLRFLCMEDNSTLQAIKADGDWYKLSSHCNEKYVSDYFLTVTKSID